MTQKPNFHVNLEGGRLKRNQQKFGNHTLTNLIIRCWEVINQSLSRGFKTYFSNEEIYPPRFRSDVDKLSDMNTEKPSSKNLDQQNTWI